MMQLLLWTALFFNCVSSLPSLHKRLFDTTAASSTASSAVFPNNLFTLFNIEAAGAYSITGFNGAKITYPSVIPGAGLQSSAAFAIDPAQKKLVFNQGESGNQYVFANGTYITLNTTGTSAPLNCTYLPYVNYTQEVAAISNLTLQDVYYQKINNVFSPVKLFSSISVDASSCGTMIEFTIATTDEGYIRGIYAAEPFNIPAYGSPTGAAVASSALIFDTTTVVTGTPDPAFFQLPASCFPRGPSTNPNSHPTPTNYCAATGYGAPPTPVCNLFPPIQ